jgi:hypothetical protein
MPCIAHPRGFTDTLFPFDPATDRDPCGCPVVTMIFGNVDVSSHLLCLPHLMAKLGHKFVGPPYSMVP